MHRGLCRRLRFFFTVASVVLVLSSVPYLYGYLSCPPDREYLGLVGRDVPGAYMYFMWQAQAREGAVLFADRLTPEKHSPFYFNLEWLLLGTWQRLLGFSLEAAFQLERGLTIVIALGIFYYFLCSFFPEADHRKWVFLWIIFTSGLGWIVWIFSLQAENPWSLRLWDIEGINLFGYLINKPHFIRCLSLACLSYALLLRGEQNGRRSYFFLSGITMALQGLMRPYDLPTALLLLTLLPIVLCLREGRFSLHRIANYAIAAAAALPVGAYYYYLDKQSLLGRIFQGVDLPALSPLELLLWLGIPLLLAVAGYDGVKNFRKWSVPVTFLYLWGLITGSLIYAYPIVPWGMESAGLCYVLAPIAAGLFLFQWVVPRLSQVPPGRAGNAFAKVLRGRQTAAVGLFAILLCLPSNFILMHTILDDLSHHSYPYYLPRQVTAAFDWLAENASCSDIVISSPRYGFFLPALAGVTSFVGHHDFTIDYDDKAEMSARFFDPSESSRSRAELVQHHDVRYVLCVGAECDFARQHPQLFWQTVFTNQDATVFRVDHHRLQSCF